MSKSITDYQTIIEPNPNGNKYYLKVFYGSYSHKYPITADEYDNYTFIVFKKKPHIKHKKVKRDLKPITLLNEQTQ